MDLTAANLVLLVAVGLAAGIINGVVGSGTLLTFPVLVALGIPPVSANGTNTTALVAGTISAAWTTRRQLLARRRRVTPLAIVSFVFALGGALLVIVLPPAVFTAVVPWLIGGAVVLVAIQPWLVRRLRARDRPAEAPDGPPGKGLLAAIACTGTYGGYFGAGQGVMLLAVLGVLDDPDPRRANGVKNLLSTAANLAGAIVFIVTGRVVWPPALALGVGALVGGYIGGHGAQRLPAWVFRVLIVLVGIIATLSLVLRT